MTTLTESEVRDILSTEGWPDGHMAHALCISNRESDWDPDAVNTNDDGSVDRGLFQINSWWTTHAVADDFPGGLFDAERAFDPHYNARYALLIFTFGGEGWGAWATAKECGAV